MKINLSLLAPLLAMSTCASVVESKNLRTTATSPLEETSERTNEDAERRMELESRASIPASASDVLLDGAVDIGRGYNVFGMFADLSSVTVQLFDFDKMGERNVLGNKKVPLLFDVVKRVQNQVDFEEGKSKSEVSKKLSAKVGISSAGGFAGSINAEFKGEKSNKESSSFIRYYDNVPVWEIKINKYRAEEGKALRDYLNPAIQKQIDASYNNTALYKELFDYIGSHYLSGGVWGGQFKMTRIFAADEVSSSMSMQVQAEASYGVVSGNLDVSASGSSDAAKEKGKFTMITKGGAVHLTSTNTNPEAFGKWKESILVTPTLIDFSDMNGLTPIWTLCKTEEEEERMKEFYDEIWAKFKGKVFNFSPKYIVDIKIVKMEDKHLFTTDGWQKTQVDPKDTSPYFIGYKTAAYDKNDPKTHSAVIFLDLKVNRREHDARCRDGETRLPFDLNENDKKGYWVFLCMKKGDPTKYAPYREIEVLTPGGKEIQGWERFGLADSPVSIIGTNVGGPVSV